MTNESIAHKWVYHPELSWSSNYSNMSFGSRKLYSYNSVLARNVDGVIHIDHRIATYSNSSQKQATHLRRAIPSTWTVFEYDFSAESALHWYLEQAMYLLDKQSRARTRDYTSKAFRYVSEGMKYVSIYNPDKRTSVYKQLAKLYTNRDSMLDQAKPIIEAQRKAKLAAKRKSDLKHQAARQAKLDQFTGGGAEFDPDYSGVYLKVVDDKLLTTNYITVPLTDALVLYKRWLAGKNILGAKLDHYTVVKSSSKSVTIGCTLINKKELDRVLGAQL